MASKKKRAIHLYITPTSFSFLFKKISGRKIEDYDFSDLSELRQLLSNERAKILHVVKDQEPESIYKLAKILKRDFKAVVKDLKLLEKFGFIKLTSGSKGNRRTIKPEAELHELTITLGF